VQGEPNAGFEEVEQKSDSVRKSNDADAEADVELEKKVDEEEQLAVIVDQATGDVTNSVNAAAPEAKKKKKKKKKRPVDNAGTPEDLEL